MNKIFVDKNDTAPSVVEKILATPDTRVVVVIPKQTAFKDSLSNFNLIRREATAAGKTLFIESVDSDVLALAKAAKLESTHPFFKETTRGRGAHSFSDIIPKEEGDDEPVKPKIITPTHGKKPHSASYIRERDSEEEDEEGGEDKKKIVREPSRIPTALFNSREEEEESFAEEEEKERRPRAPRRVVWGVLALVVVGALGAWITGMFFSKATVTIQFKKVSWGYQNSFVVSKTAQKTNPDTLTLAGQVFEQTKNTTESFPASGKAVVSEKAKGMMTIYNAYSSAPQSLVATTRFLTPEGKLFRLDQNVTVPGAKIEDGKIVPSSIEASVTADQAGQGSNLGPVAKLTIPGFKGSAKYDGFYGELKSGTTGGFVGEKAVPTQADIDAAQTTMKEKLSSTLKSSLLANHPADFKIIEDASEVKVTRLNINKSTDEKGNFSITGEAQFRAIGFREADLKDLLLSFAQKEHDRYVIQDGTFTYTDLKPNFEKGELKFALDAKLTLAPQFNKDDFLSGIRGQSIGDARSFLSGLFGLKEGKIVLWPRWISTLPSENEKITITTD